MPSLYVRDKDDEIIALRGLLNGYKAKAAKLERRFQEEIEPLRRKITDFEVRLRQLGADLVPEPEEEEPRKKRVMSPEGLAALRAGSAARWEEYRKAKAAGKQPPAKFTKQIDAMKRARKAKAAARKAQAGQK